MIDQLTTLVRQLTISQRIGIVFGSMFSVLLLVGLVMWAGTPQMVSAFTDLAPADAEVVTGALDGAGIPYELGNGGSSIKVPSASLGEARIAASSAGFLGGGEAGWSMFDDVGIGASEFDQQVAYQRALQGDLTEKIESLEGVGDASVTIVTADEGVLTQDDQAASASVYLKMAGGRTPDDALVQAVASLVAAGVKGLTPQAVTIVDSSGVVLSGPNNASSTALTIQGTVERSVAAKVQGYLSSILGAGKSAVAVTADLDLDQVAKTVTSYQTGEGNPPVSAQVDREVVGTGASGSTGGIPGTLSNVTGLIDYPNASPSASPSASGAPSDYLKESATINFANTQTVAQIVQAPGTIKRLSVAVLVDQEALTASGMSQEVLEAGVLAAVGADTRAAPEGRGDVVEMSPAKFATAAAAVAPGPDMMGIVGDVLPTIAGGLLALVLLFLVWRNMRALRGRAEDMQLLAARIGHAQLGAGEMAMAGGHGGYLEADLPALDSPQAKVQERIRIMAEDKPDELANLVSTWLHEDEKGRRR